MQKIEEKIRNNREKFDHADPPAGHFEKFQEKVQTMNAPAKKGIQRGFIIRVAAVIIVLITVSITLLTINNDLFHRSLFSESNAGEIPEELQEVQYYYTSLADQKLDEINALAASDEEATKVKELALQEMNALETTNEQLEEEYKESGNNDRILNAIINNYRIMTKLLDHIITEMDQTNEQESSYNLKSNRNEKIMA